MRKNRREIVGGAGHWCDLCTGQWCLQRQGEERHHVRHEENISPKAEEIVKEEDPLAFMIVTSATEIFGEGYKSYFSEKL